MSASESHCHDVPITVSKFLVQRSQTSKVHREVYRASKPQSNVRSVQEWVVKKKIEFTHNSRFPKMAQRVTMDVSRGTRMTQCRLLPDLTPCPGYATDWSAWTQWGNTSPAWNQPRAFKEDCKAEQTGGKKDCQGGQQVEVGEGG